MEVPVEINVRIVDWLSSMGYPVTGMPHELLRGMLLREARQWQLSPSRLAALINDGVRMPALAGTEPRPASWDARPPRRTAWFVGAHG